MMRGSPHVGCVCGPFGRFFGRIPNSLVAPFNGRKSGRLAWLQRNILSTLQNCRGRSCQIAGEREALHRYERLDRDCRPAGGPVSAMTIRPPACPLARGKRSQSWRRNSSCPVRSPCLDRAALARPRTFRGCFERNFEQHPKESRNVPRGPPGRFSRSSL